MASLFTVRSVKKSVVVISQPLRKDNRADGPMLGSINITIATSTFDPSFPQGNYSGPLAKLRQPRHRRLALEGHDECLVGIDGLLV